MTLAQFLACHTIALGKTLKVFKIKGSDEKRFYDLLVMNLKVSLKEYK